MIPTLLNADQMEALNLEFGLDLSYGNASHYRAAQVIHMLSRQLKDSTPAADRGADTPAAIPSPSGSALSYQGSSDDTDD
jgi:hypothetical protein